MTIQNNGLLQAQNIWIESGLYTNYLEMINDTSFNKLVFACHIHNVQAIDDFRNEWGESMSNPITDPLIISNLLKEVGHES
jgi:hypothetical protein